MCAISSGKVAFCALLVLLLLRAEPLRTVSVVILATEFVVVLDNKGGAWVAQVVVRIKGMAAGTVRMVLVTTVALLDGLLDASVLVPLVIRFGTEPDLINRDIKGY